MGLCAPVHASKGGFPELEFLGLGVQRVSELEFLGWGCREFLELEFLGWGVQERTLFSRCCRCC